MNLPKITIENIIITAIVLSIFSLAFLYVYYKPTRVLISTENVSFTVLDSRKRGALLKNNSTNIKEWHTSQKRCSITKGFTATIPVYTYDLIDREGKLFKTVIETDYNEVSDTFCK